MTTLNDPPILFVKPKAISKADKAELKAAGILVIEVADPGTVKLTRAHAEISGGAMLAAALRVIGSSEYTIKKFGSLIIEMGLAKTQMDITSSSNQ